MASTLPNFEAGPLPISYIREEARRALIAAIDSRRGKKICVLDPNISSFLGLITEVALLREHGVEQLLHLGPEELGELGVRSIIYLARSTVQNARLIAHQIKESNRVGEQHDFSVFWVPRRSVVCDKVLEDEGVMGDVLAEDFPLDWVPLDKDLLSLELDSAFKELKHDGDRSSLYFVARALMQLQSRHGAARNLKGVGPASAAVRSMLSRMRSELAAEAPPLSAPGQGIDTIILLDREVDLVTPLCTQLTYEGLIDEVFGIKNGVVQLELGAEGTRQKAVLNSADKLFAELRDSSFAAVGPSLGEKAKAIQTNYQGSKATERTMAELKEFAGELKALPNISRHISIAEELSRRIARPGFRDRVQVEQALLDGVSMDSSAERLEDMMCQGERLETVLRLLTLMSVTGSGVPKKHFDALRREILHTYGHENILTLGAMQDAGLLQKQEGGRSAFAGVKKALRLLVDDVNDTAPTDIAYTFSGYAPLGIRLVEMALKPGKGWAGIEDAFRLLPGPHFMIQQTVDGEGLPIETSAPLSRPMTGSSSQPRRRRVVVVMFIGGVTFAEIAALRFLSKQPECDADFLIATTKVVNGNTFIAQFIPDAVRTCMLQAALL